MPTRYAAVYTFFLESLEAASEREQLVEKAGARHVVGDVRRRGDGKGILNYFLPPQCGAVFRA